MPQLSAQRAAVFILLSWCFSEWHKAIWYQWGDPPSMASSHPLSVSFPSRRGFHEEAEHLFPVFDQLNDPHLNHKGSIQQAEIADSITKLFVGERFVETQNNIEWQGLVSNRILPWSARIDLSGMYKLTGK